MPQEIDILYMIKSAGIAVQLVMLALLFFSITSWAIIFIKFRYLRKAYKESASFIEVFWESRDLGIAYKESQDFIEGPIARVFRVGYLELKKVTQANQNTQASSQILNKADKTDKAEEPNKSDLSKSLFSNNKIISTTSIKRSLRRAINTEVTSMMQMIPFLATTGNITPFVGLFGTVWGIMNSFHSIGAKGSANLAVVAPGISEALITTAAGLAVAIPAVIGFNYFNQKIKILESELQSFSDDFMNIIERSILSQTGGN